MRVTLSPGPSTALRAKSSASISCWVSGQAWEWHPRQGINLSVAAFYRELKSSIETVGIPNAQLSVTYENATAATNMGYE